MTKLQLAHKASECTVALTKWMERSLIYHSRTDHGYVMSPEMAHNLAAHLAMGQIENLMRLFEETGEN